LSERPKAIRNSTFAFQYAALLRTEIVAGSVDVKREHRHRGTVWFAFASVTPLS
jgi:hypothetical protein